MTCSCSIPSKKIGGQVSSVSLGPDKSGNYKKDIESEK